MRFVFDEALGLAPLTPCDGFVPLEVSAVREVFRFLFNLVHHRPTGGQPDEPPIGKFVECGHGPSTAGKLPSNRGSAHAGL